MLAIRSMYNIRRQKGTVCTDKKENQIFLVYSDIQNRAVAKSYMTNGLLIQGADNKLGQFLTQDI